MSETDTTCTDAKCALRTAMKALLSKAFPPGATRLSPPLLRHLRSFLQERECSSLTAYLAFQEEPILQPLLQEWLSEGHLLFLPRFCQATAAYELVQATDLTNNLAPGHYGILEPLPSLPAEKTLPPTTAWLLPGLAFTRKGIRLGRGKGYYDRLLAAFPTRAPRIGVCWDCQIVPSLPQNSWDVSLDAIATPTGVFPV